MLPLKNPHSLTAPDLLHNKNKAASNPGAGYLECNQQRKELAAYQEAMQKGLSAPSPDR